MMSFSIIVATDEKGGIAKDGDLPWHVPKDLAYFKSITSDTENTDKQNAVIMGRRTWESIPEMYRPLKNRHNVVVTRNQNYSVPPDVGLAHTLESALESLVPKNIERAFVVGGGEIYQLALKMPQCQKIYRTLIRQTFDCDTFFPAIGDPFQQVASDAHQSDNGLQVSFDVYKRCA